MSHTHTKLKIDSKSAQQRNARHTKNSKSIRNQHSTERHAHTRFGGGGGGCVDQVSTFTRLLDPKQINGKLRLTWKAQKNPGGHQLQLKLGFTRMGCCGDVEMTSACVHRRRKLVPSSRHQQQCWKERNFEIGLIFVKVMFLINSGFLLFQGRGMSPRDSWQHLRLKDKCKVRTPEFFAVLEKANKQRDKGIRGFTTNILAGQRLYQKMYNVQHEH